jgi:hypothetical protein
MDIFDTELYTSIEQMPGDWDPLVSGPEDWLIAEEDMSEADLWEEMALAYEAVQEETAVVDEQAETSDLLSLFA